MQAALDYPKITIIRPQGSINGIEALEFEKDLKIALTDEGTSILLIDLRSVESLDCAGLMAMVSALKLAKALGRRLCVCSVSPLLRMIFELTQLDRVLEIFEGTPV